MINDLTKRLYAEGYTRDNHPDYVFWSDFENFGYKWERLLEMVWQTPCGLLVEGRSVASCDVSVGGVWYCPENGNPTLRCPYERKECPHRQSEFLSKYKHCACHLFDGAYDYAQSAEKIEAERNRQKQAVYMEYTGGQYCMCITPQYGRVKVNYDPQTCIRYGCTNTVCCVTKRERDLTKVNIYYDIRRTWKTRVGFLEDTRTDIQKGVKVFSKPAARTDAELWLKIKEKQYDPFEDKHIISPKITPEDRAQEFFSEHHRQYPGYDYFEFWYEVENIRIEARETRDLLQDLRDAAEGITIHHASDDQKAAKARKRAAKESRAEAKEVQKKKKLLKFFDEHWDDDKLAMHFQIKFGSEEYSRMIAEKQDEAAGIGRQIDLFEE